MWYASCSIGPHEIPSTVPVPVLVAGASAGPDSSGTFSKPIVAAGAV
jgi:hypothetical protein